MKATASLTKPKYLDLFPYTPNRPEWATMAARFEAARTVNPSASTFIGHKGGVFYFQEYGNPVGVAVSDVEA